ncbi:TPM domain-containing protein [Enterococcus sp. LJL98]
MRHKKFFFSLFLFLSFFLSHLTNVPVWADSPTVTDEAGLFTAEERDELTRLAQEINQAIKGEIFITTQIANETDPETFSDNFLRDRIGNDQNGSVLLLDMTQREIYISTSGNMIDYLDDARIETLLDAVYDGMASGDYLQAAQSYLSLTKEYVAKGVPRGHYRVDRETGKITYYKVLTLGEMLFALAIALVISAGFFIVIKSRYQLKRGTYTYPFLEQSSFQLKKKEDHLTNSFVTTRRIPKPSSNSGGGSGGGGSTTHSSGGGSFGGGGRSF